MRGKEPFQHLSVPHPGITPACAGKSDKLEVLANADQDHPRVCGEKGLHPHALLWAGGSPPRVRGKAPPWTTRGFRCRITPACAGKSTQRNQVTSHQKDHPRVCGEKFACVCASTWSSGSPPRVRGKVPVIQYINVSARITPACAGKRKTAKSMMAKHWDHPRVCGEKQPDCLLCSPGRGSPPRVRGKD